MNFKPSKKFLKKNILLQRDLFAFLHWRECEKMALSKKSKISKEKFSKMSRSLVTYYKKNRLSRKTKSLRIYSRFNETTLSKLWLKTPKKSIFEDFFPHKKPFLTFWVFPLLGGCFLASLTWGQHNPTKKNNFGFPNLVIPCSSDLSFDQKILNTSTFFDFLKKSRKTKKNRTQDFSFISFYKKPINESVAVPTVSSHVENLCSFYLNVTNNSLGYFTKQDLVSQEYTVQNFENLTALNILLNSNINGYCIWHSLNTLPNKLVLNVSKENICSRQSEFTLSKSAPFNRDPFLQKIKNDDLPISNNYDNSFSQLKSLLRQEYKIPHIFYLEASKIFDNWITRITTHQTVRLKEKNLQKSFQNKEFMSNPTFYNTIQLEALDALDRLKSSHFKISNINNRESLTFYCNEFLKSFHKNGEVLKQSAFGSESMLTTPKLTSKLAEFKDENIPFSFFLENSLKNKLSSKFLLKQIQKDSKYHLLKTLFINRFYEKKGNSKKAINRFFPQMIFPTKLNKKRLKKNATHSILRSMIVSQFFKPTRFFDTRIQEIYKKEQFVKDLYNGKNALLNSTNNDFKKFVFELMLGKFWKNIFPNLDAFISNKIKIDQQKKTHQKIDSNVFKKTSRYHEKSIKKVNELMINETFLYGRLKMISRELLKLERLNQKKVVESKINNSAKIFMYKTPILMSDVFPFTRNFFDGDLNAKFFDTKTTADETKGFGTTFGRPLIPWSEPAVKTSEKRNKVILNPTPILNNLRFLHFFSDVSSAFKKVQLTCLKNDSISHFLDLFQIVNPHQTQQYLNKIGFQKNIPNSFSIRKKLTISKKAKMFLLKKSKNELCKACKYQLKDVQEKNFKKSPFLSNSLDQRNAEKLFRAYLSIKYPENFIQNTSQWSPILPVLQQFKKVVKIKFKKDYPVSGNLIIKRAPIKIRKQGAISKKGQKISIDISLKKIFPYFAWKEESNLNRIDRVLSKQTVLNPEKYLSRLIGYTHFLKFKELELNDSQIKRLEKKKFLEKKRRFKKLKLENRRRKKRKRFYPRPNQLRFELYNSFLQKRHPKVLKITKNAFRLSADRNSRIQSRFSSKIVKFRENASLLKNKIFRQKNEKWGNLTHNLFFDEKEQFKKLVFDWADPTYHQKEFYKISNETLTNFERLCWKSYWLRSNLIPYVQRIQKTLKKMKEIQVLKESRTSFSMILHKLMLSVFPRIANPYPISKSWISENEKSKTDAGAYLNFKNTLDSSILTNSNVQNTKILENRAEYDRLLYDRITEEIRNVKAQLNVEGQKQPRSYKLGRQKPYQQKVKNSFSSFMFSGPSFLEPKIQPFLTRISNGHSAIKPLGDWPTLRLLWVCNKTNLWTFKETNFVRELWSKYKIREQTKNNKTKKFLKKNLKISGLIPKNLETMSLNKVEQGLRKTQAFGISIPFKTSKTYLSDLKNRLRNQTCLNTHNRSIAKSRITDEPNVSRKTSLWIPHFFKSEQLLWFETSLGLRFPKRMTHFWWSIGQNNPIEKTVDLWFLSPQQFFDLDYFVPNNTNRFLGNDVRFSNKEVGNNFMLNYGFWCCCLLLHFSIFFVIVRIPEIRGLCKFQLLVLSKFGNLYLICLFNLYELIQNYGKKVKLLIQRSPSIYRLPNIDLGSTSKPVARLKPGLSTWELNDSSAIPSWFSFTNQKQLIFEENPRPFVSKSFLQSTISYQFYFRNIFAINLQSETNSRTLDGYRKFFSYAIGPFFDSNDTLPEKLHFNHFEKKEWFYSSLGFKWPIFPKHPGGAKERIDLGLIQKKKGRTKRLKGALFSEGNQKASNSEITFYTKRKQFWKFDETSIQLQSLSALFFLNSTRLVFNISYYCLNSFYKLIYKIIDILESILLIFYKFFEKPAEVVVEWLADFFLVQWSSDITSYIPEAFDIALWNSTTKFARSIRIPSGPLFGFFVQRTFLSNVENLYRWLLRPDADLLGRQKKGIVFWDVWAEILLQAAERYKMNLSSLSTIKEEQDLLIENLLEEKSAFSKKAQINSLETAPKENQNTPFLNSIILQKSLTKMRPLMKFLDSNPSEDFKIRASVVTTCSTKVLNDPYKFFKQKQSSMHTRQFTKQWFESHESSENTPRGEGWKRWGVNQSMNMQGRDTDLFMDIHPPRSFSNVGFLKLYSSAQETLGTLVCDIYSGLFNKRVSKNILIIGPAGSVKSIFVQALAGETELKIVIDNSKRYALVQGGVPVGMKLLREVFDSITMHTPCLFLLEDIHVIGERRPMLISDDESTRAQESTFGSEQEEVHESNKLIYQASRHSVSNYKKPYKGDFSLSIPTNYFCYDFFLGVPTSRKRSSELTSRSPLSMIDLEKAIESKDASNRETHLPKELTFLSVLEISAKQLFAPPATSPFTILLMKEQQRLKLKKGVKQLPWSGLSYEQSMLITKSQYSVRSKVALLAEISMNTLSVKLDMITDLLVIIDSVRSNRGFVVFATTHLPSLLDPALRRPGRLDETLSLPSLPNLNSRFQILKTRLASYQENFDCFDYSLIEGEMQENETRLASKISDNLLLLLNTKGTKKGKLSISLKSHKASLKPNLFFDYPIYSISQALTAASTLYLKKSGFKQSQKIFNSSKRASSRETNLAMLTNNRLGFSILNTSMSNVVSLVYGQAGQFLIESSLSKDLRGYTRKDLKHQLDQDNSPAIREEERVFKILYNSNKQSNSLLLKLFAGKFSEFFVFNNDFYNYFHRSKTSIKRWSLHGLKNVKQKSVTKGLFFDKNVSRQYRASLDLRRGWWLNADSSIRTNPSQFNRTESLNNFKNYWQSATSYIESILQKRYSVKKNSIVSKLILFEDQSVLREPSSPPKSSILMPARKFENYKRTLSTFFEQPMLTINEKLKLHQKQRFLKILYKVSLKSGLETTFRQNAFNLDKTNKRNFNFSDSFKELGYLDLITLKPTASFCYYRNAFLTRHRFSFLNQWWNGQLAEHNVETTYLSHVDWRSMFIESLGDISLDFPDAEQYYNPKSRRWFLNSKSWESWQSFEKIPRTEIAEHCLFSCFSKISNNLNENREFLDYLAFRFLRYHNLQEIDLLNFSVRFHKTRDIFNG